MFTMRFDEKLPIPMEVKKMYPLSEPLAKKIHERNEAIRRVFAGEDSRLLLIIGPCSADREDSVMEYVKRLAAIQAETGDKLLIIPRIFTNKPRTHGEGYMGMLHQPNPREKPDLLKGIIATRELHMRVVQETGFVSADEMLYPENYKYVDDLLGYVSVGARSVENQQHRLTASGLDTPVGMKNPTGGDLEVMMNAVYTARHGHTFLYRGWQVESEGNPLAHAILRGYQKPDGRYVSNISREAIEWVVEAFGSMELDQPAVVIDASHGNSGKNPYRQPENVAQILKIRSANEKLRAAIKGIMVESYLEDGSQAADGTVFGQSITDPCLGWEKTKELIYRICNG